MAYRRRLPFGSGPDYLGLMCLRNPDEVATTVASSTDIVLEPGLRDLLCQPRFRIVPDDSHACATRIHPPPGSPGPGAAPAEL